ncbi:MAG: hypothetical protein HND54_02820 [Bacteroidetes bacterium]|nr:hypothetical protein [Bacteroidota bacterium]
MSGLINWEHSPKPIHQYNQPPLFFYLIAFMQYLFGQGEIVMHLLLSVFTLLSLIYFNKISTLLGVAQKRLLLVIFAFCPAFIVNQNLMTDIPILAISLGAMYYLFQGLRTEKTIYFIISSTLLGFGLLIKYSLFPLFLVILLTILLTKNSKRVAVLIVPVTFLFLWSIWNLFEFDYIHLLNRPKPVFHSRKIISFLSSLGSMSFFTAVFIYSILPKQMVKSLIILGFIFFTVSVPLVYFDIIAESNYNRVLNFMFIGNGLLLIAFVVKRVFELLIKEKKDKYHLFNFSIALYIIGFTLFIGLFAPFNASRHVLLLIPFLLLLGHKQFEKSHKTINNLVVLTTIFLGLMLGISDWVYADFYRKSPFMVEVKAERTWSVGHWGWQWYSKKAGMKIYSKKEDLKIRNNDIVVIPKDIPKQYISSRIKLDTIDYISQKSNFLTFFSGKNFASMYLTLSEKPAWSLSKETIDTIFVCKVKKELNLKDIRTRIISNRDWYKAIKNKAIEDSISIDSALFIEAKQTLIKQRNNSPTGFN